MSTVYPLFLRVEGRLVLVVGGGSIAERKVDELVKAQARIRVVSPQVTQELARRASAGDIEHIARSVVEADLDDAWLCIACTDDEAVQREVGRWCEARRLFCLAVDDLANATAYAGSIVRRPPFVIAISSSAEAPALTKLVRQVIEHVLPPDSFVARARELRRSWKQHKVPHDERFRALVNDILGITRDERKPDS